MEEVDKRAKEYSGNLDLTFESRMHIQKYDFEETFKAGFESGFQHYMERVNKGFEYLRRDCRNVYLVGLVKEIPKSATKEEVDDEAFSHEFADTHSSGWDEGDFWGDIYLQLTDELYMKFEVYA